jgi:hypothetical protein
MSVPSYTVLFLLCLGCFSAQAATIYVRSTGNDATSCAQAQNASTPRRTINAGIACLSGGDTLIVHGGTYTEIVGPLPSGLSTSQPTTLRAAPGETVLVQPSSSPPGTSIGALSGEGNYLVIDGINVDARFLTGRMLAVSGHDNIFRNMNLQGSYSQGIYGDVTNTQFVNLEVHHSGQYCPGHSDPYCPEHGFHHGFYMSADSGPGNVIDGCNIHDIADGHGLQLYGGTWVVKNSRIADIPYGNGIFALTNNVVMYNNLLINAGSANSFGAGIYVTAGGAKIYHNTFYTASSNGNQVGIYLRPSDTIVRNNILMNVATSSGSYIVRENGGATLDHNLCTVAATGCDAVEPTMARIVLDTASGNFHLVANSPAIGSGILVPEVTVDKDGNPLPRTGAVDVGAYQYAPKGPVLPAPQHLRATVQ